MVVLRVLGAVVGTTIVVGTLLSAVRTVVVPRAESVAITRVVFLILRKLFGLVARLRPDWAWTDRIMSLYAPSALLTLPLTWVGLLFAGFSLLFLAVGEPAAHAWDLSGSSLLTLGFTKPDTGLGVGLAFIGAALTIAIVVLLLVTYLPSMYAAFAARERQVMLFTSRAGTPPTGVEFLERLSRIRGLGEIDPIWQSWEQWFAAVQESHTSQPALVHFRSHHPEQSWITAAGALLDAAALYVSCVDHGAVAAQQSAGSGQPHTGSEVRRVPHAELCLRAGYLCLRDIADFFGIAFDPDPRPDDSIAVTREEFDEVWERMQAAGVPLVDDRDQAWADFAGWRVNYDTCLLKLADLVVAPRTPWTSDRSAPLRHGAGGPTGGRPPR